MKTTSYVIFLLIACLNFMGCSPTVEDFNEEASLLEENEEFEEAIAKRTRALELDPNNVEALVNRGTDKVILEDYEGAKKDFDALLKVSDSHTEAYLCRGKCLRHMEEPLAALDDLNTAASLAGGDSAQTELEEVLFERGLTYFELDSLHAAFRDIDYCINKHYQLTQAFYMRGIMHITLGRIPEGCQDLRAAEDRGHSEAEEIRSQYCK